MTGRGDNRHIERVWLAQSFLDDFILIYPVYAIMMQEYGLGELELSTLFVIWSVAALVFEIPSGVIGDHVNRARYAAVGSCIRALGYLIWLLFPGFGGFALGFLFWSLGSAIHSGTLQSLLHDALIEQGRESEFARIYGRGKAAQSAGVLIAMGLGGFAAENGYPLVLIPSALAPLLAAALIVVFISEPARSNRSTGEAEPESTLRVALGAMIGNRTLLTVSAMFLFFMGLSGVLDEYIGPLLAEPEILSLGVIGVLYGGILGARAIGTALAHRLDRLTLRQIGAVSALAHGLLLGGLLLAGLFIGNPLVYGALVCLWGVSYFAIMGAVEVLLETHMQQEIDVHARATITSLAGAGLEVWGICLFLLIGFSAAGTSWSVALALVAALAVLLSLILSVAAGRLGQEIMLPGR